MWNIVVVSGPIVGLATMMYALVLSPLHVQTDNLIEEAIELDIHAGELSHRLIALAQSDAAATLPSDLLWEAANRSDAQVELQRVITGLANNNGVQLSRFGSPQRHDNQGESRISLDIEGEATLAATVLFVAEIERSTPRIAINNLLIRPSQYRQPIDGETLIYLRLQLWGFWGSQL